MALVLYPDPNADSFVTVAEADDYISRLTLDFAQWDSLIEEDKERYLRIAYRDIIDNTDPDTYPDLLPECVGESQSLMASNDLIIGISSGTYSAQSNLIKRNKVGSIEQEFYSGYKLIKEPTRVPDQASTCLEELGYNTIKTTGVTQTTLGRK